MSEAKKKAKATAVPMYAISDLEDMVSQGCSVPGCTVHHEETYLTQRCHPGGGLDACYTRHSAVIRLRCKVCKQPVCDFPVALIAVDKHRPPS